MQNLSSQSIEKSIILNSTPAELFQRWTTRDGLKTFFGADNKVELKLHGAFEIYFLMDAPDGGRGSEKCQILSFIQDEMLSFTWNAPPHLEARNSDIFTYVVINFDEITEEKTMLTLRHLGWPDDERFPAVFEYFEQAWDYVLNSLEKSLE
jgi:uncharacterized protein YndB with AHSA1/START domain